MTGRLSDLLPPLVIACDTCKRRGSYRVCGLIARFGPHARLEEIVQALTQSCPHQHRPGERRGNQYTSPGCLARIEPPRARPLPPPGHHHTLNHAVDEWLPDRISIAQHLALVTGPLAVAVYEAAIARDPHGRITLRQGARVIRRSFEEPQQDYPPGKWEPKP